MSARAIDAKYQTITFVISNDLEWDGESKRIIACGDGREKSVNFCHSSF